MAMASSISISCANFSINSISPVAQTKRPASFSPQGRRWCGTVGEGGFGTSSDNPGLRQWSQARTSRLSGKREQRWDSRNAWRAMVGFKETTLMERQWGPPIPLGTAQLPQDVDLIKLRSLLYQWGTGLTQNANLPLPAPLKVDKVEGGLRLAYIKVNNGKIEDLVHIDVLVSPPSEDEPKAMFRALRNGQWKNSVPPGEPLIMQSLLAALKKSLPLARSS